MGEHPRLTARKEQGPEIPLLENGCRVLGDPDGGRDTELGPPQGDRCGLPMRTHSRIFLKSGRAA